MSRGVDAARAATHDGNADVTELVAELARDFEAVLSRLPRPDHGHSIFVLRGELPLDVENYRRVVDFAEKRRIIFVLACQDMAAEILNTPELTAQVHGTPPIGNGLGGIDADAVNVHEPVPRGLKN
jgi:hypothetical protein